LSVVEEEVARTVALLDEPSRQVLMALAIAEGGATVEAVASMTGGPSGELSQGVVLTALSLLVEVQLAMADRHHGRYGLLSSATGHVVAAHADDPAWQAGRARHTAYHVERARAFARRPHGSPMDTEWLLDHRNRLAALARLREAGNREGALRLAVDCMPGFLHRSESEDGRRLLAEVLSQTPERTSGACISAHVWLGRLEAERADGVRTIAARAHFETALRLARERGNLIIHLEVLNAIAENQVTLEDGVQLCEEAVAEALALTEAPELAFGRAVFLNWHGGNLHRRGELAEAARCIGEAIDIARSYGDRRLLMSFAIFHWQLPEEVRRDDIGVPALSEVLEMAVEQGDLRTEGWVYIFIVGNCIEASDDQGAVARGLEMARLARRTKQAPIARQLLVSMVRLLVDHADPALRVRLAAVLASHAEMTAAQLPPRWVAAFDAALASAHEELGEDGFGSAWRAGLATSVWAALDLAEERLEKLRTAVAPTESLGGGSAARVHRRRAAAAIGAPRNGAGATLDSLTPRERDVLDGLVRGGSNKEIARDLGMRPKTVAHHCAAIYAKLEVRNRTEAVREALRTTPVR
jgi:DNA-binding CsgD family transcriptional regulator